MKAFFRLCSGLFDVCADILCFMLHWSKKDAFDIYRSGLTWNYNEQASYNSSILFLVSSSYFFLYFVTKSVYFPLLWGTKTHFLTNISFLREEKNLTYLVAYAFSLAIS